jgi:hypothetical protein
MTSKRIALALALGILVGGGLARAADPTPSQVYQAPEGGKLTGTQQMMGQVLREHPRSAEAHWLAAQLAARAGQYGPARRELRTAQRLAPGLPFARPRSVLALERQLGLAPSGAPPAPRRHAFPLGLFLVLIAVALILWTVLRRRAALLGYPQDPGSMPAGGMPPPGYGPGGYLGGYVPGTGPGLMGNIASGLALGAGVAAGENFHSGQEGGGVAQGDAGPATGNSDMEAKDLGHSDPGSREDDGGGGGWDDAGGMTGGGDGGGWT